MTTVEHPKTFKAAEKLKAMHHRLVLPSVQAINSR